MISIETSIGALFNESEALLTTILDKLGDACVPGALVEFSPEEADLAGAFAETGLDERDAWDSVIDHPGTTAAGE